MMQENILFPYLEDGQIAPQISDWQVRLRESAAAVLSVLSDAVEACSVRSFEKDLTDSENAFAQILHDFRDDVVRISERIPLPRGFFVGDAERIPAFAQVCRLLSLSEVHASELRTLSMRVSLLAETLNEQKRTQNHATLLCCEIGAAAKNNGDTATQRTVAALAKELDEHAEHTARVQVRFLKIKEKITHFCVRILPDFCNRMVTEADMEHEGASCNPASAARLCGEVRAAIEELL